MLTKRIIPVITVKNGIMVKTIGFNNQSARPVSSPMSATQIFEDRGIDELILIDIDTDRPNFKLLEKFVNCCFMPLTIGGGIRTIDDITQLLRAGADKVAIQTAKDILPEAIDKFGSQCIVGVVNYGRWYPVDAVKMARHLEELGCGEILLQSVDRDGVMKGYDLESLKKVSSAVNIPIIACGGCGSPQDALEAIEAGADAVAASSIYLFRDITPQDINNYLFEHNISVRHEGGINGTK